MSVSFLVYEDALGKFWDDWRVGWLEGGLMVWSSGASDPCILGYCEKIVELSVKIAHKSQSIVTDGDNFGQG